MMKFLFVFIGLIISNHIYSQSIFSELSINKKYDILENIKVSKVTMTSIFYSDDKTEKKKEIIYLNDNFYEVKGEYFNSTDEMTGSFTSSLRNDSLILERNSVSKIPYLGLESVKIKYFYDHNNYLIRKEKYNNKKQLIEIVHLVNDDFGNPIKLVLNNGEYGLARYNYLENKFISGVYSNDGKLLSENNSKINFKLKDSNYQYDEYGNTIFNGKYFFIYKYDKFNNWIKQTRYLLLNNSKVKNAEFIRKIYYK